MTRYDIYIRYARSGCKRLFNPFDLGPIHNVIPLSSQCLSWHTIFAPLKRQFGRFFKIRFERFDRSPFLIIPTYLYPTVIPTNVSFRTECLGCLLSKTERWLTIFLVPVRIPAERRIQSYSSTRPSSFLPVSFAVTTTSGVLLPQSVICFNKRRSCVWWHPRETTGRRGELKWNAASSSLFACRFEGIDTVQCVFHRFSQAISCWQIFDRVCGSRDSTDLVSLRVIFGW